MPSKGSHIQATLTFGSWRLQDLAQRLAPGAAKPQAYRTHGRLGATGSVPSCQRAAFIPLSRATCLPHRTPRLQSMMNLTGKFLIAMPALSDARFARSVVLLCNHSESGTMGLIVNKPLVEITFDTLLKQLKIAPDAEVSAPPVHFGGPVETGRGFVLHSPDWSDPEATQTIALAGNKTVCLTGTLDVLRAIAAGAGPKDAMLALGYAGWAAGQLEGEIRRNDWLVSEASPEIVFTTPVAARWEAALRLLGIDAQALSLTAGTA